MPKIPVFEVYDAWDSINEYCDALPELSEESLLVFSRVNLEKFQWTKRDVDFGDAMNNFPTDTFSYDKGSLEVILDKIKKICAYCEGYHNENCYVSGTRKAIEILLFGKFFPLKMNTFGEYLVNLRAVTHQQVQEAYIVQKMTNSNIGSLCIALSKLKPSEVVEILKIQKFIPKPFGGIAVEKGYLSQEEVNFVSDFQKKNYLYIGDVLISLGYLTKEEKNSCLEKYLLKKKEKNKKS